MSFEDSWGSATYNIFWYAKFAVPVVAATLAFFLRHKAVMLLLLAMAAPMTYALSVNAIRTKWEVRFEAAKTEREKAIVASSDGANLVAGAMFIAPFEAIVYNAMAFGVAAGMLGLRQNRERSRVGGSAGSGSAPGAHP